MKYIDAEKLIAEIERRKNEWEALINKNNAVNPTAVKEVMYEDLNILDIITSLQVEQPDKYEPALEKARGWMSNVNQGGHAMLIDIFPELGEGLDPRYNGRKQEQPEGIEGIVHHALGVHYIITNQEQLNARLKQFPNDAKVEIFINARKEE